jgi:hypothetical protein
MAALEILQLEPLVTSISILFLPIFSAQIYDHLLIQIGMKPLTLERGASNNNDIAILFCGVVGAK